MRLQCLLFDNDLLRPPVDVAVANIQSRTDYASRLQAVLMTKPLSYLYLVLQYSWSTRKQLLPQKTQSSC
ncbi:hypothetical protein ACROYT_G005258 [Oculina patagonica]